MRFIYNVATMQILDMQGKTIATVVDDRQAATLTAAPLMLEALRETAEVFQTTAKAADLNVGARLVRRIHQALKEARKTPRPSLDFLECDPINSTFCIECEITYDADAYDWCPICFDRDAQHAETMDRLHQERAA